MALEEIGGPDPHCCNNKTEEESIQTSSVPRMKQLIKLVRDVSICYITVGRRKKVMLNDQDGSNTYPYRVIDECGLRGAYCTFGLTLSHKPVVNRKNGAIVKPNATTRNEEGSQRNGRRVACHADLQWSRRLRT